MVAAAREARLKGVGVELNPWLVWYSRWAAWRGGVAASTSFITKDLWRLNLQDYQNIVIFGVEEMVSLNGVCYGEVVCRNDISGRVERVNCGVLEW